MTIANGRMQRRVRAEDCVFGRWDRDFDHRCEPEGKHVRCWFSIVSSICEEQINRTADLIQELWQYRRIADVVGGEIRTDNLAIDKIKTEVQLALSASFALGFMLLLMPFALTEDLQASTAHDQID